MPNNSPGTVIENRVGIIFDSNAPVITNTAFNTIWEQGDITEVEHHEYQNGLFVNVFPNPATSNVTFSINGNIAYNYTIYLMDATGRKIATQHVSNTNRSEMNLSGISSGLYFYTVVAEGSVLSSGKIIKE